MVDGVERDGVWVGDSRCREVSWLHRRCTGTGSVGPKAWEFATAIWSCSLEQPVPEDRRARVRLFGSRARGVWFGVARRGVELLYCSVNVRNNDATQYWTVRAEQKKQRQDLGDSGDYEAMMERGDLLASVTMTRAKVSEAVERPRCPANHGFSASRAAAITRALCVGACSDQSEQWTAGEGGTPATYAARAAVRTASP